jgi:hypothetical protein
MEMMKNEFSFQLKDVKTMVWDFLLTYIKNQPKTHKHKIIIGARLPGLLRGPKSAFYKNSLFWSSTVLAFKTSDFSQNVVCNF